MRNALFGSAALLGAAFVVFAATAQTGQEADGDDHHGSSWTSGDDDELRVRDEQHQTFRLDPGAEVRIEKIVGPVTVETGGDAAEVHIVRMGATEQDLACYRTESSGGGARLLVRTVRDERRECRQIRSRQQVRIVLPRNVNLSLSNIAGRLELGAIDGALRLASIAGSVRAAGLRSGEISSVAGRLTLTLGQIDNRGISISSVAGATEIDFGAGANADIAVSSVIGRVSSLSDRITVSNEGRRNYRARVGTGGPIVSVSSIVGPVRLRAS